jgi:hypothetical protein
MRLNVDRRRSIFIGGAVRTAVVARALLVVERRAGGRKILAQSSIIAPLTRLSC